MTATAIADTTGMSRSDWLAARRKGIGGSDMAAILGLDSFRTPLAVYLDKVGELSDDDEPSEAMEWGNRLEDAVAEGTLDRIRHQTALDVPGLGVDDPSITIRRSHRILAHRDHPWLLANVDRTVHGHPAGPGVLECKTTGVWAAKTWEDDDPDHLPDKYVIQQQHYLDVLGWDHGWIGVLIGGNRLRVEHINRDDDLIAGLHQVAEQFWQRVVDGRPPPVGPDDYDLVRKLHPDRQAGSKVTVPSGVAEVLERHEMHRRMEDAAKKAKQAAAAEVLQLIGDAEEGWLPGADKPALTYRQQSRAGIDAKRLAADHPGIATAYATKSTFRVLRISKEFKS